MAPMAASFLVLEDIASDDIVRILLVVMEKSAFVTLPWDKKACDSTNSLVVQKKNTEYEFVDGVTFALSSEKVVGLAINQQKTGRVYSNDLTQEGQPPLNFAKLVWVARNSCYMTFYHRLILE